MVISIILLLILFILFVPIKLNISASKSSLNIKLYNILLFSPHKGLLNNYIKKHFNNFLSPKSNSFTTKKTTKSPQSTSPFYKLFKNRKLSILKLYKKVSSNKFKPSFKLIGVIDFEIEDAATTAIIYGITFAFTPFFYFLFSRVFKVKTLNLDIQPHFTGKNILNFSINSIISFNIAQIIYILVLTIKCFEIKKEVAL